MQQTCKFDVSKIADIEKLFKNFDEQGVIAAYFIESLGDYVKPKNLKDGGLFCVFAAMNKQNLLTMFLEKDHSRLAIAENEIELPKTREQLRQTINDFVNKTIVQPTIIN